MSADHPEPATTHRQILQRMGITVTVEPPRDYGISIDVQGGGADLLEFLVDEELAGSFSQEIIDRAKNGRDLLRRTVEAALVQKLQN